MQEKAISCPFWFKKYISEIGCQKNCNSTMNLSYSSSCLHLGFIVWFSIVSSTIWNLTLFMLMFESFIIRWNLQAYPFLVDWSVVYDDPLRPLVVDVGSGNITWLICLK